MYSKLGIASLISSMLSAVAIILIFVISGRIEASTPGGLQAYSGAAVLVGIFFACYGLSFVSFCLGIAGIIQKVPNRRPAVLGAIFSLATLLITFVLIYIGMTTGQA